VAVLTCKISVRACAAGKERREFGGASFSAINRAEWICLRGIVLNGKGTITN
jgi:hypothetical protein